MPSCNVSSKLFLDALNRENFSGRPPVWIMRQAGRYQPSYQALRKKHRLLNLFMTPELIQKVTHLPIDEFGMDAAILFSDILLPVMPLGYHLDYVDGKGPVVTPGGTKKTLECVGEGIKLLKKSLNVPLIGFAGGPFTVATYIYGGIEKAKGELYKNPKEFHSILRDLTDVTIDYLNMQIDSGVDALQLFDSWAGMLELSALQEFALPYAKEILTAVHAKNKKMIYFSRNTSIFAREIAALGFDGISVDWSRPLSELREMLGPNITLQGNLDPRILQADLATVAHRTQKLLDEMKNDPAYIFNLGHGVFPDTPPESVAAIVSTVQS
ncbi:MAG: uroporphyrinogen decarboxylase [Simkaniaceae bacterium]|nr:uroporphyrinogen decarboxylase [Simkaniaceae bacterium]